jgi:hypothetical protein
LSILIFSIPGDAHAILVELALKTLGAAPETIFITDLPSQATASIGVGGVSPGMEVRHRTAGGTIRLDRFDTVWFRRMHHPVLTDVHPDDREFAERSWKEIRLIYEQVFQLTGAFCLNPPVSYPLARSKPFQLQLARQSGLSVPETLISNDAQEVSEFIAGNLRSGRGTIVKNFSIPLWYNAEKGAGFATGTEVVTLEDIAAANIRACPAIYQQQIPKSYEVRILCLGRHLVAARLLLQGWGDKDVDFRLEKDWSKLGISSIPVPTSVSDSLLRIFQRLNLLCGSADFIVDEEGQWHFLEINEMGNFLWLEQYCPEMPVLDMFCRFLTSRDPRFRLDSDYRPSISLSGIHQSADVSRRIAEEMAQHPDTNAYGATVEAAS